MAEERLPRQPDHDIGILAQGPEHGERLNLVVGLAQDVNRLRFELGQAVHHGLVDGGAVRDRKTPHKEGG